MFTLPARQKTMKPIPPRAQAMVEFALALPIFLMALYGLLEVGRAVFMEAAVASASREGARYATAWSVTTGIIPQYQDCAGIRKAAKNVGFLLGLADSNVAISYDTGPGTSSTPYCNPSTIPTLTACNRVIVTVSATYRPILPLFLPLTTQNMASTTRRTLMGLVDLDNPTSCP